MPWTLTYYEPKEPELLDAFFIAVGKALCLANNFESRCEHYLKIIAYTDSMRENKDQSSALVAVSKIESIPLARQLKKIHELGDITEIELEILTKARESRNFIAHEGAALGEIYYSDAKSFLERVLVLRPHVAAVAAGDNITSRWEYEVSEREPAPHHFIDEYEQKIIGWVFDDIFEKLRVAITT